MPRWWTVSMISLRCAKDLISPLFAVTDGEITRCAGLTVAATRRDCADHAHHPDPCSQAFDCADRGVLCALVARGAADEPARRFLIVRSCPRRQTFRCHDRALS